MNDRTYRVLLSKETAKYKSRREAAKKIGIPPASLANYIETDAVPIMRCLKKISSFFDVTVPDLLREYQNEHLLTPPDVHEPRKTFAADTPGKDDKYKIVAEVGEILDSGNVDIIDALVKNVRAFRRAVDTEKDLRECKAMMVGMQTKMDEMDQKIDRLTAPPITAKRSVVTSGKGET